MKRNKYAIRYTKDGHYTSHCFDSVKELKGILSNLTGIKVEYYYEEGDPINIHTLILEHNWKHANIITHEPTI
jgi:hypothetical protein